MISRASPSGAVRAMLLLAAFSLLAGCIAASPPPSEGPRGSPPADSLTRVGFATATIPDGNGMGGAILESPAARYVLTGFRGAEPSIGATSSGALFVTSLDLTLRSRDGGFTWEAVQEHLPGAGAFHPALTTWDPALWVDAATDRVLVNHLAPAYACSFLYWSESEGESWSSRPGACAAPTIDHQKIAAGPPGPEAPPIAGLRYPSVLSLCSNKLVGTFCSLSYDGGLSWTAEGAPFPPGVAPHDPRRLDCSYGAGSPAIAPDGTMAIAKSWQCSRLFVSVSRDSGLTWTIREGPPVPGATIDPELAFSPDGALFALWQSSSDHLPYLARSPDLGETWEGPWVVSPPDVRSTVFAALAAPGSGRVALAYLGTEDAADAPGVAPDSTRWHLYIVTSDDAGAASPEFVATRVTPEEDPVQIGCIHVGADPVPCRNLLDFIDGVVAPDGRFLVAYTEGCTIGCAGKPDAKPEDSRSSDVAVAWLEP